MSKHWAVWIAAIGIIALVPMAMAANGGMRQVSGDIVIYLGVLPADMIRGHPPESPEGGMHGGAAPGESHVMVALFERASGRRIVDALVQAKISGKGMERVQKPLEAMTVAGALAYGNYFALLGPGPYRIEVEIRLPGAAKPLRATFQWGRS